MQVDYRDLAGQAAYVVGDWCPHDRPGGKFLDNCISSIRVLQGWRAVVYEHGHFLGASLEVTGDIADLAQVPGPCKGSFNDCISSIQVLRR